MSAFCDIHCHILPGVDDGPADVAAAVELVRGLEALGFTHFYPTPHRKPGSWDPTTAETTAAAEALRAALAEVGSSATVHDPAREVMLGGELALGEGAKLPRYPGGQAFLMEFPGSGPPPFLEDRLFEMRLAGEVPVVAHVERYPALVTNQQRLEALGRVAALQVNLSSVGGWWYGRGARRLVREGWVHLLATDAHGVGDLAASERGMQWIRGALGDDVLHRLLEHNPRRIIGGELPEP